MKITRVSVYSTWLPYVGGEYGWGPGRVLTGGRSIVAVVDTDAGISGCGEVCPIGANYLAAYAEGALAAQPLLAAAVIGVDPRGVHDIERRMDEALKGHGYAKAPIDAACWDILGKSAGMPVHMLLGGLLTPAAPMYRVAPQKPGQQMVAEMNVHRAAGYRQFQIKVGADADADIERIHAVAEVLEPGERAYADANTGWSVRDAVRVVRAVESLGLMIEQPCLTYEECLQVRAHTTLPMKLDECVSDLAMAARIVADRSAEVVCIKISNVGGLTKARRVRDFLVANGVSLVCEDAWGGEIVTATLSHLAASTPPELLYNTTDLHHYNTRSTGTPGPTTSNGCLLAPVTPGLGVEPDLAALGEPVAVYQ